MSFLSRAEISRDDYYVCVCCLSVSVLSDLMAAKGDFRFFFFNFYTHSHIDTKIHRLLSKQKLTICYNKTLLSSSSSF